MKVKINFSLIILIALTLYFDKTNICFASLAAITAHESGHIFVLIRRKIKITKIHLRLFGLLIYTDGHLSSYESDLTTACAGILANFLVAVIFLFLYFVFNIYYFGLLFAANVITLLFNSIPIKGFDGYDIIYIFRNL